VPPDSGDIGNVLGHITNQKRFAEFLNSPMSLSPFGGRIDVIACLHIDPINDPTQYRIVVCIHLPIVNCVYRLGAFRAHGCKRSIFVIDHCDYVGKVLALADLIDF
jgi:hypothetical protein